MDGDTPSFCNPSQPYRELPPHASLRGGLPQDDEAIQKNPGLPRAPSTDSGSLAMTPVRGYKAAR